MANANQDRDNSGRFTESANKNQGSSKSGGSNKGGSSSSSNKTANR